MTFFHGSERSTVVEPVKVTTLHCSPTPGTSSERGLYDQSRRYSERSCSIAGLLQPSPLHYCRMQGHLGSAMSASDASHFNSLKTTGQFEQGQVSTSDDGSMEKMPGPTRRRRRLSGFTGRTKAKTKKLFRLDGAEADEQSEDEEGDPLHTENDSPFNSSQLTKKNEFRPVKTADKALRAIQSLGNAVTHPVKSAKSTATRTTAGQLSKAERPFLSQKADIQFLQAHDDLKHAESTGSSKQGTCDEEQESLIGGHRDKLREMEEHRESLRVSWTTGRHVMRVVPKRHINFPNNEYFVERDERGVFVHYKWLKWLGYVILRHSGYKARVLTSRNRTLSIMRKGSALSTLMTLMSFPLTLIAQDVTLNDW